MVVKLSAKGEKFGANSEQLQQIKRIFNDLYSDFNETGTLNAGVAESTLMYQELLDYFNANLKMEPIDLTYGDESALKALSCHVFPLKLASAQIGRL